MMFSVFLPSGLTHQKAGANDLTEHKRGVIPAEAGIHKIKRHYCQYLDSHFRGNDNPFNQVRQRINQTYRKASAYHLTEHLRSCCVFLVLLLLLSLPGCAHRTSFLQQEESQHSTLAPQTTVTPSMNLVYPDEIFSDSIVYIPQLDSVFLFGNVSGPDGILTVGGRKIEIHSSGGWLAWIGFEKYIEPGEDSPFGRRPAGGVTLQYDPPSIEQGAETGISRTLWFLQPHRDKEIVPLVIQPFNARLEVVEDVSAKIRCGWPGTYDLFPPAGTVLWTDGYKDAGRRFYRVALGAGEVGWIEDEFVSVDTLGKKPGTSIIHFISSSVKERRTEIRIPLNGDPPPFRIKRVANDRLELTLYGAMSWTDAIFQPSGSRVVDEIRWRQLDPATYRLTAFIRPEWFWGWDADFDNEGALIWNIHEAPALGKKPLKGLTLMIDPGHGGSNIGAVGTTGSAEKEVTLPLAMMVKDELERAGAKVLLTRTEDVAVGLTERVEFAKRENVDIVISLHYNALPQGQNPYRHHGTSVHYNHRHSRDLAGALLESITSSIGWEGNGLRYQDLAIPRLTFCPSALIENGFLLHPEEEALAWNEGFRKATAKGIRNGLEKWLDDLRVEQKK